MVAGMSDGDREVLARIRRGQLYTETEASFQNPQRRSDLIFDYNQTRPGDTERRRSLLEAILGSVGARTVLLAPFHAGFGGNVHIGDDFFGNVNLTFVDDVEIRIGNGVMIAPGTTLTTTGHPIHPDLRVDFRRFSVPIVIEDKVWIGSHAVVLPGVRIGYGSVVGAGSVVTHDIPAMTVAVGVPCRVARQITDEDLDARTRRGAPAGNAAGGDAARGDAARGDAAGGDAARGDTARGDDSIRDLTP
jgi:galactoside O-acetyltransferase